jgi:hypothetical protein
MYSKNVQGLGFHELKVSFIMMNQQDHSWIIWVRFCFTMEGHVMMGNLNSNYIIALYGGAELLVFYKTICSS